LVIAGLAPPLALEKRKFHWRRVVGYMMVIMGVIGVVGLVVAIVGGYYYNWSWTGLGDYTYIKTDDREEVQRSKTLWDWTNLLIVPFILAVGVYYFSRTEKRNELRIAEQQAQDAALQTYLDQMTDLLLTKQLRSSQPHAEVRDVARVRTLTALRRLDSDRRTILIRFLHDSNLIDNDPTNSVVDLRGADLGGTDLSHTVFSLISGASINLSEANLGGTNLSHSVLSHVNLSNAFLWGADLHDAWLGEANLENANMPNTDLRKATMLDANLSGANLKGADLRGASLSRANLRGADLLGANLKGADLREANLEDSDLTSTNLRGTWLQGANLRKSKLTGGTGAPLKEDEFFWILLDTAWVGADLTGADLTGADLTGAKVTTKQLARCKSLKGVTMPDGTERD